MTTPTQMSTPIVGIITNRDQSPTSSLFLHSSLFLIQEDTSGSTHVCSRLDKIHILKFKSHWLLSATINMGDQCRGYH